MPVALAIMDDTQQRQEIICDARLALMVRWLLKNAATIQQFEIGSIELHFNGKQVKGKLIQVALEEPERCP